MNRFQRKVALRVLGIHVGVILFFLIISSLKGCFRPKDKPEIVTFIEFGQAAPPVAVEQVQDMPDPVEEPPPPDPTPAPAPDPSPAKIPDPPKKTIKPKVEKKEPVIKKKEPEKPKWTPTKASDIDINKSKKITPKKPKPTITQKDLDRLKDVQSNEKLPTTTAPGPVGNPDADAAYISQIGRYFDQRWNEPGNASPASSVVYRIYISQWGTITKRTKIQGSGDSAFDASVAAAVNSVDTAPKPPSGFPYKYVEVEFRIRN